MKDKLTLDQQRQYLLSKIGDSVEFKYPEGDFSVNPRIGTLKDRFVIFDSEDDSVVYWNLIDLIEFKGYPENWLRMTYYRYKVQEMRWVFAVRLHYLTPSAASCRCFLTQSRKNLGSKTSSRKSRVNVQKN